jgi:hypothetical protein
VERSSMRKEETAQGDNKARRPWSTTPVM